MCFFSLRSFAFFASIYQDSKDSHSVDRPTHFLLAADGFESKTLTQEAALSKALYIKRVFPNDQVIMLANYSSLLLDSTDSENISGIDNFEKWKLQIVYYPRSHESHKNLLSTVAIIDYMRMYSQIRSIQYFGHSSVFAGMILTDGYHLGGVEATYLYAARLNGHFTKDAFAIMYGCNSGWKLAHRLSEIWGIPVSGSFTGSLFERLAADGRFKLTESKTEKYAESNMGVPCSEGGCIRMIPQNAPYKGHWGIYDVPTLNFNKFFCRGTRDEMNQCYKGMAYSILSAVTQYKNPIVKGKINSATYRQIVNDTLCSINWNGMRAKCFEFLNSYDLATKQFSEPRNSFFMLGPYGQLDVNFFDHNFEVECRKQDVRVLSPVCEFKPKVANKPRAQVDTLAREFEAYMAGYLLIKNNL